MNFKYDMITALLTLITALSISAVAAYVSVTGMMAIFPAVATTIMVAMASLEVGKLVAANWLKFNWENPDVNYWHRITLTTIVVVLMMITSLGIYGFLSKGYLEQKSPVAGVELAITQKEQNIKMLEADNTRLQRKLDQLDANISSFLKGDNAERANTVLSRQNKERLVIENEVKANNANIKLLHGEILPLKVSTSDVEAKLGPIKYVAELFGWQDTGTAVRMVILLLIFVFDPLAVLLLLAASISFNTWQTGRKKTVSLATTDNFNDADLPVPHHVDTVKPADTCNGELSPSTEAVHAMAEKLTTEPVIELSLLPIEPSPPREPILDRPKKKRNSRSKVKAVGLTSDSDDSSESYQSSLKRLAAAYLGGEQTLQLVSENDEDKLIEVLGTSMTDVRAEGNLESKVQVPESEMPLISNKLDDGVTGVPQNQLEANLKSTSWLTKSN